MPNWNYDYPPEWDEPEFDEEDDDLPTLIGDARAAAEDPYLPRARRRACDQLLRKAEAEAKRRGLLCI